MSTKKPPGSIPFSAIETAKALPKTAIFSTLEAAAKIHEPASIRLARMATQATRVLNLSRTSAEVAANQGSHFNSNIDGSPAYNGPSIDGVTTVGPDDDVELNAVHRFRLEPDDGQPVEFVGSLIARAAVQRGDSQHTWVGLYRTRGGKIISEIIRDDGRARNVAARLGDRFRSVKVFDTVEVALASIRSAVLRNQLLGDLGLLKTKFID
jgi:hypothetical protein